MPKRCIELWGHPGGELVPHCRVCWNWEYDDRYRGLHWDEAADGPFTPAKPVPADSEFTRSAQAEIGVWRLSPGEGLRPPCEYQGEVVSAARCGELGHLRQCLHPTEDIDLCTRGANGGAVASCLRCVHHVARLEVLK